MAETLGSNEHDWSKQSRSSALIQCKGSMFEAGYQQGICPRLLGGPRHVTSDLTLEVASRWITNPQLSSLALNVASHLINIAVIFSTVLLSSRIANSSRCHQSRHIYHA
jgi:hypothetical protein